MTIRGFEKTLQSYFFHNFSQIAFMCINEIIPFGNHDCLAETSSALGMKSLPLESEPWKTKVSQTM